jgi:hypothetical protein
MPAPVKTTADFLVTRDGLVIAVLFQKTPLDRQKPPKPSPWRK